MPTFEQFYNQTLPVIINVLNAQSNEILIQRYIIYGLIGIWIIYAIYKLFTKFIHIERKKKKKA